MMPVKRLLIFVDARKWCSAFVREAEDAPYEQIALGGEQPFRWREDALETMIDSLQWPRNAVNVQILIRSVKPLEFQDLALPKTEGWTVQEVSEIAQSSAFQTFRGAKQWVFNAVPLKDPRTRFPIHRASPDTIYLYTYPLWLPPAAADGEQPDLVEVMRKIAQMEQRQTNTEESVPHGQLDPAVFCQIAREQAQESPAARPTSQGIDIRILQQIKENG